MPQRILVLVVVSLGLNLFALVTVFVNEIVLGSTLLAVLVVSAALSALAVLLFLWPLSIDKSKKDKNMVPAVVRQSLVVPIRAGRVCMINSSDGTDWLFPKGKIDPGEIPGEAALRETWEEAGLVGTLHALWGSYVYEKNGLTQFVYVFTMTVTEEVDQWPENGKRKRRWLPPREAAEQLGTRHAALRPLLLNGATSSSRENHLQ